MTNEKLNVYLKIGVKSSYNINKIVSELTSITQIKNEEEYIYFYFGEMNDNEEYKSIIKRMIINII